ncbi:HNH endonuclease domain-containing protein [Phytophthora infestans]|uniref:HNH endonuclease domain-containing protein n=1 Tax=Phytophthora infestans TaxID=4787 RepID=A0A833SWA2_PHYIN|nr:HNH endonuclease domain-containing protein [Phytophthora infestans]KAF4129437.1 HNH endonuclease domain-containing protein [Phytophthora infestans]
MLTTTEETSQQLVSVLETYAGGGATVEELEYTAELLVATAEEETANQDRAQVVSTFVEVLNGTEFLDAGQLPTIAEQLCDLLLGTEDDDSEEELESYAAKRRRVRKERLKTQFGIGKSCLVVLEEDEEWHPARITKHIGENDDESTGDNRPIEVEVEFIEFGKKQIAREDEVVLDEDVAGREDAEDMTGLCEMCERPMNLTAHHVIPRVTHSKYLRQGYTKEFLNTCIMICRQCHSKIHSVEDNKTLAREYNTLDKIMQHPEIIAWVAYARKQKARVKPRKRSKWPVGK